jgi:hypothetical protein
LRTRIRKKEKEKEKEKEKNNHVDLFKGTKCSLFKNITGRQ